MQNNFWANISVNKLMKKLIIILGTISISMSAIFGRLSTAPSVILVFYRMLFAVALLLPVVLIKCKNELKDLKKMDVLRCACSGLFLGMHFTLYFQSLKFTSIAAAVVLVNMEVFFVAIVMMLVWHEKIPAKGLLGIVVAFLGTVIIAVADMGGGTNVVLGDIFAFVGSLCVAIYTMIGKKCRERLSTSVYTCFVYGFAALTVAAAAIVTGTPFTGYNPMNLAYAFGMTIFCTFLGHSVYSWGLKYLSASYITTIKLLEPLFAAVLGFFFFGEVPGILVVIGGCVIVAGILWYSKIDAEREQQSD